MKIETVKQLQTRARELVLSRSLSPKDAVACLTAQGVDPRLAMIAIAEVVNQ